MPPAGILRPSFHDLHMSPRDLSVSVLLLIAAGAILYSFVRGPASRSAAASSGVLSPAPLVDEPLVDEPLGPARERLLEVAFEAASEIPAMPHIKTRSRAQELVVVARLELDQPHRARSAIERIDNWRRGTGYADLALYSARKGDEREARRHLAQAVQMSDTMATEAYMEAANEGIEGAQAWRRDRIRAKVACAQLLLGEAEQAAATAANLERSEAAPVVAMRAKLAGASAFEDQPRLLQQAAEAGSLEEIQNALVSGIEVYQAIYADQVKRLQLELALEACIHRAPPRVRVDLYARLADCALAHGDAQKALELVNDARFASEVGEWRPEDGIAIAVRLAQLRFRAGEREQSRAELDAALATFEASLDEISDLDRADTLCPIAAAYRSMEDPGAALGVYRRAVEEGARNPNAVPRAEDLVATLTSMALHGVEPDAALWEHVMEIRRGLREPW